MSGRAFDPSEALASEQAAAAEREKLRRMRTEGELRALVKVLEKELTLKEARLDALLSLDDVTDRVAIAPKKKSGAGQAVSVSVASDWHFEEEVEKKKVSGLNEFNVAIASRSIDNFFRHTVNLIELSRAKREIRQHVLVLGGDFYSGYIHEDLAEVAAMSPIKSVLWLEEKIAAGVRYLLERADLDRLIVPCVIGNHGRITKYMRVSTAQEHSLEYLMYHHLARLFKDERRVEFAIADGYHLWIDVGGVQVRVHHGDNVRYGGGVGGLAIPLNKALGAWNKARRADLDVLGHWHQLLWLPHAVVNGSLIGYGPFSVHIKADFERPQQAFFLIDYEYRCRTVCAPIFVR